jgi:hypothetical protein
MRRGLTIFFAVLLVFGSGAALGAQAKSGPPAILAPADEASRDPALSMMIAELLAACERKDPEPFRRALSPNAIASFGQEQPGIEAFIAVHSLEDPASPFWTEFPRALRLGGAFMDAENFGAPYVYAIFPDDFDPFEFVAAVGPRTVLRDAPDAASTIVKDVTHHILKIQPYADPGAMNGWLKAAAVDTGGTVFAVGYVRTEDIRSPISYRAVFQKTENRWWLGAFVAGD